MSAPTRKLVFGEKHFRLTADIGGFRRFKQTTRAMGLGQLDRHGRARGLSVLNGDLADGLDEETIAVFLSCLAGEEGVSLDELEEFLSDRTALEDALELIADLLSEAFPDEEADTGESDSDRNQEEDEEEDEVADPFVATPSSDTSPTVSSTSA